MREPNLQELLESLASENFTEEVFMNGRDADTEIIQLLYFMQEKQTAALYKQITQMTDSKKRNVIDSLIRLYPLSKNIITALLRKREAVPVDFLRIYDMDCMMLHNIRNTLAEIKDNSTSTNIQYKRYLSEIEEESKKIDALRSGIEQLNAVSKEAKEKRETREQLQEQLEMLKKDYESGGLENDIQALEEEIEELKIRKVKRIRDKKQLDQELNEIKESLRHEEDDATRKYCRAFSELEKCIKSITEGV